MLTCRVTFIPCGLLRVREIRPVTKERGHSTLAYNFVKCWPFFSQKSLPVGLNSKYATEVSRTHLKRVAAVTL